jgi:hypothetical protein
MEAWRGELFCIGFGLAGRADRQRGIAEFLQDIVLMAATAATVSVNWHVWLQKNELYLKRLSTKGLGEFSIF